MVQDKLAQVIHSLKLTFNQCKLDWFIFVPYLIVVFFIQVIISNFFFDVKDPESLRLFFSSFNLKQISLIALLFLYPLINAYTLSMGLSIRSVKVISIKKSNKLFLSKLATLFKVYFLIFICWASIIVFSSIFSGNIIFNFINLCLILIFTLKLLFLPSLVFYRNLDVLEYLNLFFNILKNNFIEVCLFVSLFISLIFCKLICSLVLLNLDVSGVSYILDTIVSSLSSVIILLFIMNFLIVILEKNNSEELLN
ncbi:hypothetical protein DID75_00845 [Candidatus Marinamargulisbacteria bacterium SCGC AG-410-N11]|nr:hypothetical protein DID75_00845 [Candidatus Marinamargulisbacteria bacterium SCGC AG-410-N11]